MKPKPQFYYNLITIAFFIALLVCCLRNVSAWKVREAAQRQHAQISLQRETFIAQRDELKALSASYELAAEERREMMANTRKLMSVCKGPKDFFPVYDDLVMASHQNQRTDGFDVRIIVPEPDRHVLRVLVQHAAIPKSKTVVDMDDHVLEVLLDQEIRLDNEVSQVTVDKVLGESSDDLGNADVGNDFREGFVFKLNGKLRKQLPFPGVPRLTGSFSSGRRYVAIRPNQPSEFNFADSWIYRGGLLWQVPDGLEHRIFMTCWLDQDQTPTVSADDPMAVRDILSVAKWSTMASPFIAPKSYEYQGDGIYSVQPNESWID